MAEFMIKSADELSKMDAEGLAGYYTELNTHKANEMNALIEAKASKEDIESLRTELSDSRDQQMKQLNAVLETQGLAIKRLSAVEKEERAKNMYENQRHRLLDSVLKLLELC
jgi:predicted phage tail protein